MAKRTSLKKTSKTVAKTVARKKAKPVASPSSLLAKDFLKQLMTLQSDEELRKIRRYFKSGEGQYGEGDKFIGVRMGQLFALAKTFMDMEPVEIEKLLEHPVHEARAGAVSIMDFQARSKKTPATRRKELYDLYIERHDCINNWDLVDRSAPYVVGGYLHDKPRGVLYKLARSKNMWERRTAIVSTFFFIRQGDVDDTFKIAEMLLRDKEDLVQKATGGWLRAAGAKAPARLYEFLDKYASTMPRTTLRYATERLDKKRREHYLSLAKL
jgi:3-methyladenine DNA glycosylase AlkD